MTMSKLDVRKHPDYSKTIGRIRNVKLRPLVGPRDLDEVAAITDVLPDLTFPINSAGELLDQLDETLPIMGMSVDPVRMIMYMPAHYFPVVSYENFVEKVAELIRANRRQVDTPKTVRKIKEKMRGVKFPIETPEELQRALGDTPHFNVGRRKMDTRRTVGEVPPDFFPIHDQKDLEVKAIRYLRSRPLIEKD
jgi:hypothetical protein